MRPNALLKSTVSQQSNLPGLFSEEKALSVKKLGNGHWAKQNGHNNYQFLILTLLFFEFEIELIK